MRSLLIAGTAIASLLGADAAMAGERMVTRGPGMGGPGMGGGMNRGGWNAPRPMPQPQMHPQGRPPMPQVGQSRWGSKVSGRWWGGANAPGGWNAYRRPVRGWALPTYWNTPRFYVSDWSAYGLQQPQYGYNWVRYYDDAVLVDTRGSVYDTVGDVQWDRYDGGDGAYGYDDQVYAGQGGYAPAPAPAYRDDRGHDDGGYTDRGYDDRGYERREGGPRRENGVGGALAGAAVGGVAGALIGGRGNRVGGALIGAGVGGVAGYAIDKAEDRGRPAPPPPRGGYGASYARPGYAPAYAPRPDYAPGYAPRPYPPARGGQWVSPDGGTTVVTSGGGWGGSTTTVTVQTAPVITTTTTEIYEDHVTWSRPAKKVWKPRRKVVCSCR